MTLRPEQDALIARLKDVFEADDRIASAWLAGSTGKGTADAFSDIDITAVLEDEDDRAACVAEYGGRQNPVCETLWLRHEFGRLVMAVTAEWERYDIHFMTGPEFRAVDPATVKPLVRANRPPSGKSFAGEPSPPEKLHGIVQEFLRVLGLLFVGAGRHEILVGAEGTRLQRNALIDLMIEANGNPARGGAKRLNEFLTEDQRLALEDTLRFEPTVEGLIKANLDIARLFLPLAKQIFAERGMTWPAKFEDATLAHLKRRLGVEL